MHKRAVPCEHLQRLLDVIEANGLVVDSLDPYVSTTVTCKLHNMHVDMSDMSVEAFDAKDA